LAQIIDSPKSLKEKAGENDVHRGFERLQPISGTLEGYMHAKEFVHSQDSLSSSAILYE
jgi:hypothetical protein